MKILVRILAIAAIVLLIGAIAFFYALYNSNAANEQVLEDQRFDESIDQIDISVDNARVELLPSEDDTARIVLSGTSDGFTFRSDATEGRLDIEFEERFRLFSFGFNRSYLLTVHVPDSGVESLSAESDNGRIDARQFSARELRLETDNGRIDGTAIDSERIEVQTDNGAVTLSNLDAAISVRASNGRIIFTDVSGELEARANNGRIELTADTIAFPVDFETDNGRIEIRTDTEPENARIEASTDNGRIDIYGRANEETIFGNGDIRVRLKTDNGRIVVE